MSCYIEECSRKVTLYHIQDKKIETRELVDKNELYNFRLTHFPSGKVVLSGGFKIDTYSLLEIVSHKVYLLNVELIKLEE